VAFELFEVAVVGIGVSFASIRHEQDLGELPKARQRYRSLMYQWKGRRKVAGMKEILVGEQHRWWYSTVDADNAIVQISLRENSIVEICRREWWNGKWQLGAYPAGLVAECQSKA